MTRKQIVFYFVVTYYIDMKSVTYVNAVNFRRRHLTNRVNTHICRRVGSVGIQFQKISIKRNAHVIW